MGWDGHYAEHWKNGRPDVMAEFMDRYKDFGGQQSPCEVVKAVKVGSVIYSAVRNKKTDEVFGVVSLTSIDKGYVMFKEMSEDMLPYYYDCPKSVLNLLSKTEEANALEWRKKCEEQAELKKTSPTYLKNSKVGDMLIYMDRDILIHCPPMAQFRTDFWKMLGENRYVQKTDVNPNTAVGYSREALEQSFIKTMEALGSKELYHGMPSILSGTLTDENGEVHNGIKQIPTMYSALMNNSLPLDKPLELQNMGATKGNLFITFDGEKVGFFKTDIAPYVVDGEVHTTSEYSKESFDGACLEAIQSLEAKLTEYSKTVSKANIEEAENTLMQTFGKSDVGIEHKQIQRGQEK